MEEKKVSKDSKNYKIGYKGLKGFSDHIGIVMTFLENGVAKAELQLNDDLRNPMGAAHGGVIFSLADTVSGIAAAQLEHTNTVTISSTCEFLRTTIGAEKIFAEAIPKKREGKIVFYDVIVTDDKGVEVALFQFTFYKIYKKTVVNREEHSADK